MLDDADLDHAADAVVQAMTTLNGQWCRALGRLLVQRSVAEELLDKVRSRFTQVVLGSSMDADSDMGPLVHQGHRQHVEAAVARYEAAGAELLQVTP